MDHGAIERATQRLEETRDRADAGAALERARAGVEALAEAVAELQASLPGRVGEAIREGFRAEALPVGRQVAEVRGLQNHLLRRLEELQHELAAERHARVDDLALLVDLIASGWRDVAARVERLEQAAAGRGAEEAVVHRLDQRAG